MGPGQLEVGEVVDPALGVGSDAPFRLGFVDDGGTQGLDRLGGALAGLDVLHGQIVVFVPPGCLGTVLDYNHKGEEAHCDDPGNAA